MKSLFVKTAFAAALAAASLSASAVGRVADVQITDRATGHSLPTYFHQGEYWVAGQPGAKYAIQIRNARGPRVLAVTSVDGLNVLSGETADFSQSGYVFSSGQRYGIEGWRKSDREVAAFVFTASGDSYAERIGKPRDMGVIGVALFREQAAPVVAPAPLPAPRVKKHAHEQESQDHTAEKSSRAESSAAPMPSAKLGTAHGERETSVVSHTEFKRRSARPDEVIRIRYDSTANLIAMGIIPSAYATPLQPQPRAFPGEARYVPDPPAWR